MYRLFDSQNLTAQLGIIKFFRPFHIVVIKPKALSRPIQFFKVNASPFAEAYEFDCRLSMFRDNHTFTALGGGDKFRKPGFCLA